MEFPLFCGVCCFIPPICQVPFPLSLPLLTFQHFKAQDARCQMCQKYFRHEKYVLTLWFIFVKRTTLETIRGLPDYSSAVRTIMKLGLLFFPFTPVCPCVCFQLEKCDNFTMRYHKWTWLMSFDVGYTMMPFAYEIILVICIMVKTGAAWTFRSRPTVCPPVTKFSFHAYPLAISSLKRLCLSICNSIWIVILEGTIIYSKSWLTSIQEYVWLIAWSKVCKIYI